MMADSMRDSIVLHKWHTFLETPIGSICSKYRETVQELLAAWGKYQLQRYGVLESLRAFVTQRPAAALRPDFADLWFLYYTVRRRQPRAIVEFGSGCSTVVLAQALADNGHTAHLHAVETQKEWARVTEWALPSHLRPWCDVVVSPLVEADLDGVHGFRHAYMPAVAPNLVYLDGPGFTVEHTAIRHLFAVDVLAMEECMPADFLLIIDGRKHQTLFLQQHLRKKYQFKARKLFRNQVFERVE
jgi:hypothetical protein